MRSTFQETNNDRLQKRCTSDLTEHSCMNQCPVPDSCRRLRNIEFTITTTYQTWLTRTSSFDIAPQDKKMRFPTKLLCCVDKLRRFWHNSFILETYIAPLQETTTQRRSQPSHGQKRRTSERCKIWKGGPSARNAAQRGDHSMLMDPQPNINKIFGNGLSIIQSYRNDA